MVSYFSQQNCKSSFSHAKGTDQTLSVAVSTLSASLTQTKTTLTELAGRTLRSGEREELDFENMTLLLKDCNLYAREADTIKRYV